MDFDPIDLISLFLVYNLVTSIPHKVLQLSLIAHFLQNNNYPELNSSKYLVKLKTALNIRLNLLKDITI